MTGPICCAMRAIVYGEDAHVKADSTISAIPAGAMRTIPKRLCKDEEYIPTCEEDAGHVKWFASKCCGNGLSSCHGDGVRCECWLRCLRRVPWSLSSNRACTCRVWTHDSWPVLRVVLQQLRSRRLDPQHCSSWFTQTTRRVLLHGMRHPEPSIQLQASSSPNSARG